MCYTADIPVRYRDLDRLGHVNNAVYATFFGEASVEYYDAVVGGVADHLETPLAQLEIEYQNPIEQTGTIKVPVSVINIGDTSIRMEYEIYTDETLAATGQTVQVLFDTETESTMSVPSKWRDAISHFENKEVA